MQMLLNNLVPTEILLRSPQGEGAGDSTASPGEGQAPAASAEPAAAAAVTDKTSETIISDTFETDFENLDLAFTEGLDEEDTPPAEIKPKEKAAAPAPKVVEPAKPTGQAETSKPAATPAATPAAPAKEGEQPKEAPKEGQAPETPAAAAPVQEESFLAVLEKSAEKIVPELAKLYTLPEADAKNFTPEVQQSLKNLAGMLHFNVMRAAAAMIEKLTPGIVQQHSARTAARTESEAAFFAEWPQLTKEHVPIIQKYGKLWQAANPQGKVEDYIKQVGAMAANELGLLGQPTAQIAAAGAKPAPAAKPKAIPFAPANVTSRAQIPVAETHDSNDWAANAEAIAGDFDDV